MNHICFSFISYLKYKINSYNLLPSLQDGYTALIAASGNGHTETMESLIEANAQIDLQTEASYD